MLAEQYNAPIATLNRYEKNYPKNQGRKAVFTREEIEDLVECVVGMTARDITTLVESYCNHKDHERGLKTQM